MDDEGIIEVLDDTLDADMDIPGSNEYVLCCFFRWELSYNACFCWIDVDVYWIDIFCLFQEKGFSFFPVLRACPFCTCIIYWRCYNAAVGRRGIGLVS